MEMVNSLSLPDFLLSYWRLAGRRGMPGMVVLIMLTRLRQEVHL